MRTYAYMTYIVSPLAGLCGGYIMAAARLQLVFNNSVRRKPVVIKFSRQYPERINVLQMFTILSTSP